jgi:RNA polymerase sigma factor (sigma-70 family)
MIMQKSAISIEESRGRSAGWEASESEKGLVEAAQGGQSAAFASLCERHAQQLLRAAYRITRSREDAEDAVQDAFIRAFVHLGEFDGRSSFATWLTRIAINSALMILRKKRSALDIATMRTDNPGADGRGYEIADRAPNPERRYAQRQEGRILRKAIQRLRPTLREVVEIHQLQERSMRETAEAMGISVAAAKGRLFHARAALRKSPILKPMYQYRCGADLRALSAA